MNRDARPGLPTGSPIVPYGTPGKASTATSSILLERHDAATPARNPSLSRLTGARGPTAAAAAAAAAPLSKSSLKRRGPSCPRVLLVIRIAQIECACNHPEEGSGEKPLPLSRAVDLLEETSMRCRASSVVLLALLIALLDSALANLRVAYQWKRIDYEWPSNDTKRLFPDYKQEDNLPLGLEVTSDRIFVTVPRWRQGVAANTRESPPLIPYPSWEAHQYAAAGVPEIVSTFRVRADRCNRLWVLDTGLADILGNPEQQVPPALIIYDLTNDRMLRKYVIPADQRTADSLFANIAVEDYSCEDSYGYLGDLGGPGLVVYSWSLQQSWLVKHHSFHPDPQGGDFKVSGIAFQWNDGLFGMALAPTGDGYSTLYYHPLSSGMEFSVSTRFLRDPQRASTAETSHEFQTLGSRGPNGQSSVSFLDPKTGILFYALTNMNTIACWKPQQKFTVQQQGYVYADNVTMIFPNDLKIDRNGNLWVLSDRLPIFMYSQLDLHDYNFRILMGSTEELAMGTVCSTMSPIYSTTMHDHRDHMDHMDHMNHVDRPVSTTPRIAGRFNSASSVKIESVFVTTTLLTCLIKMLV
ncbi:Protein yellow [Harpegnathos saltator]|uniref:Protein yellow n=1 Tax=Harpegnathos saltator TaxID=610380 RepID=E2B794_HARSA|nr:Protein yellow [Harpegnathos saltator]